MSHCETIFIACERGCSDCLNIEDIHKTDSVLRTALHYTACYNKDELTRKLLMLGANIEARTMYGRHPLHTACAYGSSAVVKVLLEYNANVETRDEDGWTPLHHASRFNNLECVALLLHRKVDLYVKENKGRTPSEVTRNEEIKKLFSSMINLEGDPISDDKYEHSNIG